jgi:3-oxoacyl-[acyl-carrier-protein] synthase II
MSMSRPRAVFTGIGVLTPIGLGVEPLWQGLLAGQSGVKPVHSFDASGLPIRIGGEIRNFDAKEYIDKKERKSLKVMARAIQLGVGCTTLALREGGIEPSKLDPTRFGIDFGAGLIASELDELGPASAISTNGMPGHVDMHRWGDQGIPAMPPLWLLKYLPNMPACHVSILHNAQGPSNTITESDVAALLAMGEATAIIARDQADVMLTGATDSKINPLSMTRLSLFMPTSQRNEAPEKACRPFEKNRDGMVPGEGAGILVLEALGHALKRGARIYAEVVGFGASFDLKRNGDGLARAITAALRKAGIGPEDIDHVNAQGFSTRRDDSWEARGLWKVFGSSQPNVPIFAGKSYFGSLGAASGPVELAISLLALQHGELPPTLNYDEADPELPPIAVLAGRRHEVRTPYALKVSFTDMGQCAALVVRKWMSDE